MSKGWGPGRGDDPCPRERIDPASVSFPTSLPCAPWASSALFWGRLESRAPTGRAAPISWTLTIGLHTVARQPVGRRGRERENGGRISGQEEEGTGCRVITSYLRAARKRGDEQEIGYGEGKRAEPLGHVIMKITGFKSRPKKTSTVKWYNKGIRRWIQLRQD